jgi:DNA-binding IclR family transcriptional regulator
MTDKTYEIESSRTTLDILTELHAMGEATLTELADRMDIPKSTAHIHLNTLRKGNFVVRDGDRYRLGLQFLEYGYDVRESIELYHKARSQVEAVAEETGELVNLMVEENGYGRYIYATIENDGVRLRTDPGRRVHLHTTGLGKTILAYLDEDRVEEIIDKRGLPADTDQSITDREELFATLEEIRDREFAYDEEEHMRGIGCIAVPLRNDEEVFGALSVSGPINRIRNDSFRENAVESLRDAKGVIELNMEYG